jgi:hypothetical protein
MRLIRLFTALAGLGVFVVAQPCVACTNATLNGNYGFVLTGVNSSSQLTATVGQITANGSGKLTGTETVSNNGAITSDVSITGTYSLNKNCTGTATITPSGGSASTYSLVVIGTQIEMAEIDSAFTESGYALAQGKATCSDAGIKGTVAYHGIGWKVSKSLIPVAFAGQIISNGAGSLTGTQAGSVGGVVYSESLTGSYSLTANCTGTITLTGSDVTTHSNFVLVNGGMSTLVIQTDAGTITTSYGQK